MTLASKYAAFAVLTLAGLSERGTATPETPPAPVAPRPVMPAGERLVYRASAWKGFRALGADVGTATLTVTPGKDDAGTPVVRLVARASGSAMGHSVDARAIAVLDAATGRPMRYDDTQEGGTPAGHALVFRPTQLLYLKLKHCHDCHDLAHFVERSQGGFLGIGSETVRAHCDASHCAEPAHRVWQVRHRHEADPLAADVLTTLYRARALDLVPDGPPSVLRVCVGHGIFDVTVRAVARETVEVPAGTFDALRLTLTPAPAAGTPSSARFTGLFGLAGEIELLVDAARKIPLRIRGTVPMGVDLDAEVVLTRIEPGK